MTFDELQDKWQSQENIASITIGTDVLLREVKRNQKNFAAIILRRDCLEAGIGFIMTIFFLGIGFGSKAWGFVFAAVMCFVVSMFFIIDRYLEKRKAHKSTDSIVSCAESSLHEVNHQVWLLKNVLWWYLLPIGGGIAVAVLHTMWIVRGIFANVFYATEMVQITIAIPVFVGVILYFIFVAWLYKHIYDLNQKAIENELLPRQKELQEMLDTVKKSDD
jgi:hypothetical protein